MISLKDVKNDYESLSSSGSDLCRQLNFIGVGIIWLFSNTISDGSWKITLPETLICPLFLICLSLALDLLQYLISTAIWYGIYLKNHNKDDNDEKKEVEDPEILNLIPWISWFGKILLTIAGYILIIMYILSILNQ